MKTKLLAFALFAVLSGSASAVSFAWSSATAIKYDGSNLKNASDVTGYLIFLGNGGNFESPYSIGEDSVSAVVSAIGTQVDTKSTTSAMSKISKSYSFSYEAGDQNNGDVFTMLLVYTGANDGKTYYNLSSSTYTLTGMADDTSGVENANFAFSYDTASSSGSLASGGGWTAVPEPSTAALALAGLALLLKRRKA